MELSREYPIIKVSPKGESMVMDKVVVEYTLSILLNGEIYKELLCSPGSLKALVIGKLKTENVIQSLEDINYLAVDEENRTARVELKVKKSDNLDDGQIFISPVFNKLSAISTYDRLLQHFQKFVLSSELFLSTGGVHSCALFDGENLLHHQDDISRQNALDKAIGMALLNKDLLMDKILFTSCRISSEIMKKVIYSGIKNVVSKSAPTDKAIELAKENSISLIGFARGNSLNIYA